MLQEPEEEERDDLHAHYPYECATEASIVGCVIFGLRHGCQYASGMTTRRELRSRRASFVPITDHADDEDTNCVQEGRCSYPSRIMRVIRIHADRTIRVDPPDPQDPRWPTNNAFFNAFSNAVDHGLGSGDVGAIPSAAIRLRKMRAAPGTPAGSWRKSASVL